MQAKYLVKKLQLQPHPEGGFYRETYRSDSVISVNNGASRNVSTAIYYLLEDDDKSHFHRIQSDELWFFHSGDPLEILSIVDGQLSVNLLGNNFEKDEIPQIIIPANTWFAARVKDSKGYTLVSCTVAPGFDFSDFQLADRNELTLQYPELKKIIKEFTL